MARTVRCAHASLQRQICKSPARLLLISLGVFLAASIGAKAQTDSDTKQSVQRGQALYQQSCALCHGAATTGGSGPNLAQSDLVRHDKNGTLIAPIIRDGRLDKGMPAFPTLTPANISDIVLFIHSRSGTGLAGDSLKRLLTGDPGAGMCYFNEKCSGCHSPAGDLAAIASKYSPTDLEVRFLYPPGDNRIATVSLRSGKTIKGKLLHLDAFYVAILDQDGWYRSWSLREATVKVEDPLAGHLDLLHSYTDREIHDVLAYLETLK